MTPKSPIFSGMNPWTPPRVLRNSISDAVSSLVTRKVLYRSFGGLEGVPCELDVVVARGRDGIPPPDAGEPLRGRLEGLPDPGVPLPREGDPGRGLAGVLGLADASCAGRDKGEAGRAPEELVLNPVNCPGGLLPRLGLGPPTEPIVGARGRAGCDCAPDRGDPGRGPEELVLSPVKCSDGL